MLPSFMCLQNLLPCNMHVHKNERTKKGLKVGQSGAGQSKLKEGAETACRERQSGAGWNKEEADKSQHRDAGAQTAVWNQQLNY